MEEEQTLHKITQRKSLIVDPDYGSLRPEAVKAKVQNVA